MKYWIIQCRILNDTKDNMQKSHEEIMAEMGKGITEALAAGIWIDPELCLAALKKAEAAVIKSAGIDPIFYYKLVFEEVQNAIEGKELR